MFKCPRCKYASPKNGHKDFQVITTQNVNTDSNGRIICHVSKSKE